MKPNLLPLIEKYTADNHQAWRKGLLHPSSDLHGCKRKTALELQKHPANPRPLPERARLNVGKAVHKDFQQWLSTQGSLGVELDVTPGLRDGWTGSVDLLFALKDEPGNYGLVDVKTLTSEAIYWKQKNNELPDEGWVWQASAYAHACTRMGKPVTHASILIWPLDNGHKVWVGEAGNKKQEKIQYSPFQVPVRLKTEEQVLARMLETEQAVQAPTLPLPLAGEQYVSGRKKTERDVWQRPNWRCGMCPFNGNGCNPPEAELLGKWERPTGGGHWEWKPEPAHYMDPEPTVRP